MPMTNQTANMNHVAVIVAYNEGGVQNLSIAQIKEVLKCLKKACGNPQDKAVVAKYLGLKP